MAVEAQVRLDESGKPVGTYASLLEEMRAKTYGRRSKKQLRLARDGVPVIDEEAAKKRMTVVNAEVWPTKG